MTEDRDEPGEDGMVDAIQAWIEACERQIDAEVAHEQDASEETETALAEAVDDTEAAADFVLDLIRQEREIESPTPYRGPFRE